VLAKIRKVVVQPLFKLGFSNWIVAARVIKEVNALHANLAQPSTQSVLTGSIFNHRSSRLTIPEIAHRLNWPGASS
jgi:hypothetical protein